MKACVIGAGASGITIAKSLKQRGVDFDWFEKGSAIGGLWRYNNDSGTSSAYRSLQIDTSSKSVAYPDFAVRKHWPDYMSAAQVLEYLERYAREFDVFDEVETSTEVLSVSQEGDGWAVTTDRHGARKYDAVIVANGHLTAPTKPEFPGSYTGEVLHSHDYREPEPFSGKTVVIVGMGNSACDIAVDLARVAKQVHLSTRRSAWILPKYLLGLPTDRWSMLFTRRLKLPTTVSRRLVNRLARFAVGPQERFGVPKPEHPIHREHTTVGQELLQYVAYHWIQMQPNLARLDGKNVVFDDGMVVEADVIIYATGYEATFPFLPDEVVEQAQAGGALYRRILHPEAPGLYFAGLVQPVGPTIPLVEVQGRWIAGALAGDVALPGKSEMTREIDEHRRWLQKSFVGSRRYHLEVDFRTYAGQLNIDLSN